MIQEEIFEVDMEEELQYYIQMLSQQETFLSSMSKSSEIKRLSQFISSIKSERQNLLKEIQRNRAKESQMKRQQSYLLDMIDDYQKKILSYRQSSIPKNNQKQCKPQIQPLFRQQKSTQTTMIKLEKTQGSNIQIICQGLYETYQELSRLPQKEIITSLMLKGNTQTIQWVLLKIIQLQQYILTKGKKDIMQIVSFDVFQEQLLFLSRKQTYEQKRVFVEQFSGNCFMIKGYYLQQFKEQFIQYKVYISINQDVIIYLLKGKQQIMISCNTLIIKGKLAQCLRQFTNLCSLQFYFRFPLMNVEQFHQLRNELQHSRIQSIKIVVDKTFQPYEQPEQQFLAELAGQRVGLMLKVLKRRDMITGDKQLIISFLLYRFCLFLKLLIFSLNRYRQKSYLHFNLLISQKQIRMNSSFENQMELDIFIQKCQNIARTKNLDLSTFLSQTSTHLIFDMLKSYEKIKTMFTQMTADNYLGDFLIFAMSKLQFLEPNETAILSLDGATDIWQKLQEKQYSYNQSERYQITKLTSVLFIKKDKESSLKNKLSYIRQRDCLPLCLIVQGQTNILKYLHIQYKLKTSKRFGQQQLYSISSKQLFKIIDQNELLKEVVIKGVEIQLFQQFIKILNQEEIEKGQNWIKQFKPKKSLKVSINVTLFFNLSKKQQTIGRINNLSYFIKLFLSLSNIFVLILLGRWNEIKQWSKQLLDLYEILKMVKHSRIKILGWGYYKQICQQSIPLVRSVIFGGLASFTEIDQLSFKEIRFDRQFFTNCILSIEQSLRTIFNNNAISHLSLQDCQYFPLIQRIQTLQSIILSGVTFRKSFCILSQIPQKNLKLRSIKYQAMHQQWRLSQSLFNQLQTFMIDSCHNISLENSFSRSPSNIKHLSIQISSLGTSQYLLIIFPKLINLSYLYLSHAIFNRQILIIPSNQLQELHISWNGSLSEECFKDIDLRWPFLTFITIRQCRNITENIWRLCEFKGLVKLQTDSKLGNNKKTADYLKDREIKLIIND